MTAIKVMVVDDSALARTVLTRALDADPGIEVVGVASNIEVAWGRLTRLRPDVLTLDLHLGRENGLDLLERIMDEHPTPTVVVSTMGQRGSRESVAALSAGAAFVVPKPASDQADGLALMAADLRDKVKQAAKTKARRLRSAAANGPSPGALGATTASPTPAAAIVGSSRRPELIALGTSTGGAAALARILPMFPAGSPPIVIVDHMPAGYTKAMAERLDGCCAVQVREAQGGELLVPGLALIAPGGERHLHVRRDRSGLRAHLDQGSLTDGHCPSVTELFVSVAQAVGPAAAIALMTGMGRDGATGLLAARRAGCFTVTQDEASCVVYGMPRAGLEVGASMVQASLDDLPAVLMAGAGSRLDRSMPRPARAGS